MTIKLKDIATLEDIESVVDSGDYCDQDVIDLWEEYKNLETNFNELKQEIEELRKQNIFLESELQHSAKWR